MRPKRPTRPPAPPPPIPAVVKPEDLDAINIPEVDKLPAYISVGKFQWKPPLPGPKGDKGDPGTPGAPGEPGATVRPIVPPIETDEIGNAQVTPEKLSFTPVSRPLDPPVATDEIGDGQVTQAKLDPAIMLGERITYFATRQNILSLYDISAGIPWTDIDLSAIVPEGTRSIILHCEVAIVASVPNNIADFQLRRDAAQGASMLIRAHGSSPASTILSDSGIMSITESRRIQYAATGVFYFPRISVYVYALGYIA